MVQNLQKHKKFLLRKIYWNKIISWLGARFGFLSSWRAPIILNFDLAYEFAFIALIWAEETKIGQWDVKLRGWTLPTVAALRHGLSPVYLWLRRFSLELIGCWQVLSWSTVEFSACSSVVRGLRLSSKLSAWIFCYLSFRISLNTHFFKWG